jgi:hypothetical protein
MFTAPPNLPLVIQITMVVFYAEPFIHTIKNAAQCELDHFIRSVSLRQLIAHVYEG